MRTLLIIICLVFNSSEAGLQKIISSRLNQLTQVVKNAGSEVSNFLQDQEHKKFKNYVNQMIKNAESAEKDSFLTENINLEQGVNSYIKRLETQRQKVKNEQERNEQEKKLSIIQDKLTEIKNLHREYREELVYRLTGGASNHIMGRMRYFV